MQQQATGNVRILERLVADGLITQEQREAALNVVGTLSTRVEEALIEVGALDEVRLLKYLAAMHRTRFVSTDKLSKATIDRFALEKVPRKLAEHHGLFPVMFDAQSNVLSIVTADPDNAPGLHEVQLASGAREVRAFVARPRAVRAAINRGYNGDIHAFANIDRDAHQQFTTMLDVYERNLVSDASVTASVVTDELHRERMLSASDFDAPAATGTGARGFASEAYLETLNVLVTLLETSRADLRGHSSHVARFMAKIGERIGLSDVQTGFLVIAAYVHDLGKMSVYHLTALNVAEYEAHRAAAKKAYRTPQRLLESIHLPKEALQAVESMYERYDGKGMPQGATGKEIPLGARLLAVVDTYSDLTQNPRNPFRKILQPAQACEVLVRYKQSIFDPNLVDLFKHTVTGEDLKARLLANRFRVLLVDPDPEEAMVLELRLIERGFEVSQAHTPDQALKFLENGETHLVVSELDLQPTDGFALLSEVRKRPWGRKLAWVVLTARSGGGDAQRAFELGAADYMTKPVSGEVLAAKVQALLERDSAVAGATGVTGSLAEMGLADIVQVLWHGRKSGALRIRGAAERGEIHFVGGAIFNAMWANLRGEEAFYAMLRLPDGQFSLDPKFEAPHQVIRESPEALLLEGMRRMDEGIR